MCKESCKEKGSVLEGVVTLGESGPGGAKATERPMCKKAVRKKGRFGRGGQIRGIWAWLETPRPLRSQCGRKDRRKKGRFQRGAQITEIWPWMRKGH